MPTPPATTPTIPIPQMHRYRDWVIDAFNRDLPYDEFVRDQLAGDLRGGATDEERFQRIIATGYLANARRFGSRVDDYPQHLTIEDTIDNLGRCVSRPDAELRPLPRSQVRSDHDIATTTGCTASFTARAIRGPASNWTRSSAISCHWSRPAELPEVEQMLGRADEGAVDGSTRR